MLNFSKKIWWIGAFFFVIILGGIIFFLMNKTKTVVVEKAVETAPVEEKSVETSVETETEKRVENVENILEKKVETEIEIQKKSEEKNEEIEVKKESEKSDLKIKNNLVSWGYQKTSGRTIDTIIVHSSYNALGGDEYDKDLLIEEYKEYGVSPHYLIDRNGNIYRLVEDKNIAYHAGESKTPDGRSGVNAFSIGVELINNKEDKYTKEQYASLNNLLDYLEKKYKIKYILGHSEVSPGRKDDPWNMEWGKVER